MENYQKKVIRSVFTVKKKSFITPHYIRVIFDVTNEQLDLLANVKPGSNNKIYIPPKGMNVIYFANKESNVLSELLPVMRTYTTRSIDFEKRELCIDFVAHGDNGPASAWAQKAEAGDILGIAMKGNAKDLVLQADEYLLIGDSTALPVIGNILEQLPKGVNVKAVLEVYGKKDKIDFVSQATVSVDWVYNKNPEKGSELSKWIKKISLPEIKIKRFAFIAAEYNTVKALRSYFKEEIGWERSQYNASSYWKAGKTETESNTERREEKLD
ncbi:siderophore-interacting protein [Flavobacterium aquidurense]|uniref:siderophore-interacting protein n=1 Tax=Flavobacterium aquidurense TaxID=362413 RepID=UPI0037196453